MDSPGGTVVYKEGGYEEWEEGNQLDEDKYLGDIKIEINTVLWSCLPKKATIEEAEKASILLWEEVVKLRDKYKCKGPGT